MKEAKTTTTVRPRSFAELAGKLAEANACAPFVMYIAPPWTPPDEAKLRAAFASAHPGEPSSFPVVAACAWCDRYIGAATDEVVFEEDPPPWLAPLLGLDEPEAQPAEEPQPKADEVASLSARVADLLRIRDTLIDERDAAKRALEECAEKRSAAERRHVAHLNAAFAERDKAIAERNEALRERDKAQAELADLEGSCRFGVTRIRWQPHPEHTELVRIQYRREEVPLASVKNIDGAWCWRTVEGEEGKGRSEDRAREMAAFAAGVVVSDE